MFIIECFFFFPISKQLWKWKWKKSIKIGGRKKSLTSSFEGSLIQKKTEEVCMYMQVWSRVVFLYGYKVFLRLEGCWK